MDMETRSLCADVGTKSIRFYLQRQYNGSTKPIKIGEFPAITVMQVRSAAAQKIAQITSGGRADDPVATAKHAPTKQDRAESQGIHH